MSLMQIGRIAFRHEGIYWIAYYAPESTMKDALQIGSILFNAIANDSGRREAFISLMRDVMTTAFQETLGVSPEWNEPVEAPEHEKSGHS